MGNVAKTALAACCLFFLSACNIELVTLGQGQVAVLSSNAEPCGPGAQCLEGGYNRLVELEAVPADGFVFTGWAGACEGLGTCTVRTLGQKTVVATFKSRHQVIPLMNYSDAFFFSGPWPSDLKRKADGRLNMAGYPFKNSLFERAVKRDAAQMNGFSRNDAIYIPIATDLDDWYPAEDPLYWPGFSLVNLSPDSPRYLESIPVMGTLHRDEQLQKDALLRITPDHGYSLEAATTYGLIMLEAPFGSLQYPVQKGAAMEQIIQGNATGLLQEHWELISDYLTRHTGHAPSEVAAFTVFTTQEESPNLARVREFISQRDNDEVLDSVLEVDLLDSNCTRFDDASRYADLFELKVRLPFFLQGKPPFLFTGGDLNLDPSGQLQTSSAGTEATMILVMPCNPAPAGGYPIEISALETGGTLFDYMYYELISQRNHNAIKLYVPAPYTQDRVYDGGLANLKWLEELLGIETSWIIFGLGDFNPVNWKAVEPQYLQYASDMIYAYYVGARLSHLFAERGEEDYRDRTRINPQQLTFSGISLGAMAAVNANTLYQDNRNLVTYLMPRPSIQHINNLVSGLLEDYISEQSLNALEWVLGVEFPVNLNDPTLSVMQTVIDRIDTINHLEYMGDKNVLMGLSEFSDGLHGGVAGYLYAEAFDHRYGINPVLSGPGNPSYFPIRDYNDSPAYDYGAWVTDQPARLVMTALDAYSAAQWFPYDTSRENGFTIR
ncbi:MAG: hypothetical protein VYA55_01645 [Pseudomonadota bacterium]|nr:hypothetical protein [Pseudomonadota bacterium]